MSIRAAQFLSVFVALAFLVLPGPAAAQEARAVVTTQDADYFGFDLRTEQDVSLDACAAVCLADPGCRAFTYNERAQWCFLKSDYSILNPFAGAVAGKVVTQADEPDIGAPPRLAYVPDHMRDDARRYRAGLTDIAPTSDAGLVFLSSSARSAMSAGNARQAVEAWRAALVIEPDDPEIWIALSRALFAVEPQNSSGRAQLARDGTSAALNAHALARTARLRAESLAAIGLALDRRDLHRPALQAYEESLALADKAAVRAAYLELRARRAFRVVGHSVEADIASPRVCVQFSEDLARAGTDYTSFFTVDDAPPRAVEASGRQACVEGLEHGSHYRIAVRQGLPAAIGEVIEAPVLLSVYVRDRAPSIRFSTESFVLPAAGRHGIPMVSVNAPSAELKLHRVGDRALADLLTGYMFLRQIDSYDVDSLAASLGEPVWEGAIEIADDPNREVLTSFPVGEALAERRPGVYVLTAVPEGDRSEAWSSRATQWFVVSDIGLSTYAGEDGLAVFARSLETARPLGGVEVQLLARNNEILGTATTDEAGRATLAPGLMRGAAALAPAVLTARSGEDDFVFLDMTRAGFDLSDRGVTGRAAPGAVDVFAWTERGIYRAGETVHAAALARDDRAEAVENLPLTFIFLRPDGVEERRIVSDGRALGGHHAPLDLQPTAMLGSWTLRIHTDPDAAPVAQTPFLVEEFVPDRIEFDLVADTPEIEAGEAATLSLEGRYLYGAPAAGLALEGEVAVSTTREWDRFPGYRFGLADEEVEAGLNTELVLDPTGEDGRAGFEAHADRLPSTTRLLEAKVTVRMREGGGRAVERSAVVNIRPEATVIGIRPDFAGEEVPENSVATFRVIAASPEGEREAIADAAWTLTKIERRYQWYRSNNAWNYEAVTLETRVGGGSFDISAGTAAAVSFPVEWGRYRLDVATGDPAGPMASFEFNAGWFVAATSTETPDGLEIALDRESYEAGDVARLKVSPRFAGEMLVTVGSERLYETFEVSVPAEGTEIDIPVSGEWGAGAYVAATLFRPGDAESRMPARAIGVKWLSVDPAARRLGVELGVAELAAPRRELSIPVTLTGLSPNEEAWVTVAAVDVGILNLTGYTPPDPEGWYFGPRRLGLELRDLYGRLIDGSAGAFGRLRTGGDGGGLVAQGSAPTGRLVAFFSGPVRVDGEGAAEIAFDIPEFNGTARVMAVAWSRSAIGQASADVVIRDPVVVTAGQPRFMAVGDRAAIRLDIHNTDGPAGDYAVRIDSQGPARFDFGDAPETVALAGNGRETLFLPVTALETGDAAVTVLLTHQDGLAIERTLHLPVRQPAMPVASRRIVSLAADGGSVRIDGGLLGDGLLDGASVAVGVSPAPAFDLPSLLMTLDRYPYGCAEQTVSRALPLLYVSELSATTGLEDDASMRERVQQAIDRVMTFQSSSGSFGLWGPGWGDMWLDAYVGDFLTRAREAGYEVPARGYASALDNLRNQLSYTTDIGARGTEIAYALYVLARNRRAAAGDLRYYADTRLDEFTSPMARAQIAAALALYGDGQRAETVFASALRHAQATADAGFHRSDYGSSLRDGAAMLALAAETRPSPAIVPAMMRFVAGERQGKTWTSTQENMWMVLAARAIAASGDAISLEVDGAPHEGSFARRIDGAELIDNPLVLANRGGEAVDAVITTVAAPADPLPAGGEGFSIDRSYYTLDGEHANVSEATQNDRFVVVLHVDTLNDWPMRIAVTDLLPAGFEIDNPRLVGSAELASFDWLGDPQAAHSEFRDDRFVAAFDSDSGGSFLVAYVVRAVTPGVYAHPAAVVEDMYRPQFNARTAAGMMEVIEAR